MFPKNLDTLYVSRVLTIGAGVATIFGAYWVFSGLQAAHLPAALAFSLLATLVLAALRLALACIRLLSSASLFPPTGNKQAITQANLYINVATVLQITASIAAPILLGRWGHGAMGFASVIVTVGLYLTAFAPLLRVPHYYLVGGLLTIIPVASVAVLPATIAPATGSIQTWTVVTGIVCGLIYLAFGCANLLLAVRMRRGQYHTPPSPRAFTLRQRSAELAGRDVSRRLALLLSEK